MYRGWHNPPPASNRWPHCRVHACFGVHRTTISVGGVCSNSRTGAEPDTKWVDHGLILSRSTSNVIVARLLCAYGRDGGGKAKGDKCGSAWSVLECQELGPTRSGFTVPPLGSLYLEKSNVSVAWLLRVVWEGVKGPGGGMASALCHTPMRTSDQGGRASCCVRCDYVVRMCINV